MIDDIDPVVAKLLETMPTTELLRIAPMPECEHLSGLSEDGLERYYPNLIEHMSPRRKGMRVINALLVRHRRR